MLQQNREAWEDSQWDELYAEESRLLGCIGYAEEMVAKALDELQNAQYELEVLQKELHLLGIHD